MPSRVSQYGRNVRNDEDGLTNAPWYVLFLIRVGLPTAFACALLWYLMTNVTGNLKLLSDSTSKLSSNDVTITQNQAKIIDLLIEHNQTTAMNTRFLEALCFNVAKNDMDRSRCASALPGGQR